MEVIPKRNFKNLLKELLLSSDGISRKELAARSGLDVRTVSGYVDELLKKGIIAEQSPSSSGRGRPSVLYCSNAENLAFIGIILRANSLESCCSYTNGEIIHEEKEAFKPESETKLKTIKRIFDKIEGLKLLAGKKGKIVGGIGIAVSRWLQPPLSGYDIYTDVSDIVELESGIPVFRTTPINAALYHVRGLSGLPRNMIIVHPGIVLEFGIMKNGSIPDDAREIEKNFSHISVDEKGPECYCGKHGCLEHYATHAAVDDILKSECRNDSLSEIPEFYEGLRNGIPACARTAEKVSSALAVGIAGYCRDFEAEAIAFLAAEPMSEMIIGKLKELPQFKKKKNIIFSSFSLIDIARASALMAAFEVVRNFEKK